MLPAERHAGFTTLPEIVTISFVCENNSLQNYKLAK